MIANTKYLKIVKYNRASAGTRKTFQKQKVLSRKMPVIKLKSSDEKVFEVDVEVTFKNSK